MNVRDLRNPVRIEISSTDSYMVGDPEDPMHSAIADLIESKALFDTMAEGTYYLDVFQNDEGDTAFILIVE